MAKSSSFATAHAQIGDSTLTRVGARKRVEEYVFHSELQSLLSTLAEMSDDSDVEAMLEAPFMKEGAEVGKYTSCAWRCAAILVNSHMRCHMTPCWLYLCSLLAS